MKKIFVTIFLLFSISLSALAEEWQWKQFSDYVFLDTSKINYYQDDSGYNHAAVWQKHLRKKGDKDDNRVDKICMKHYKKHLGYQIIIKDINLDKKLETIEYIVFYDTKGKTMGNVQMGRKEDCVPIPPLTVAEDIYEYVVNNKVIQE